MRSSTVEVAAFNQSLFSRQSAPCDLTDFEANVDFYGFGIRLGVYLQWFSSWISNTLDPEKCADNHEENSIFVLSILVALAVAFRTNDLKVSEVYILLLLCTGYFCICLSTWGIRLHLLRPGAVQVSPLFWHGNQLQNRRVRPSTFSRLPGGTFLNGMANQFLSPRHMPLSQGGSVKPSGLSWAGGLWRSIIASFVVALNLYLWFSYDPDANTGCEPYVYFFGRQKLTAGLQIFFIAVCITAGTFLFQLILAMTTVLYYLTLKLIIGPVLDTLRLSGLKESLLDLIAVRLQVANHEGVIPSDQVTLQQIKSALFALSSQKDSPASARPHVHSHHQAHQQGYRLSMSLVICWHIWLLSLMALFITFIEQTIQINNIQGAFIIRSTSQLIPFIIGLISMLNTVRQLLLQWYEEDHPNEENMHFVLTGRLSHMSILGMLIEGGIWVAARLRGDAVAADADDVAAGAGELREARQANPSISADAQTHESSNTCSK
ncbi:uncharacterized protein HMPREF1541_10292 [Cyphellophora europaea CBS 101466]|uniref:Uncharacterized protein n=1 Tax=Cyphellophora europaea (strain CBS 101466) TaxID=1220924 RepID=W2S7G1_CYPE1|nr:uncharacterized protein HMPREF1541_10292 [Cyphellophora europaea CBS 101466]ETN44622.1 hypothetical protein HMPREF1541_10292 [Cyphellophora europaea CBS 101466]